MALRSDDTIEVSGEVVELSRGNFVVKLENGMMISSSGSGNIRKNKIKIIVGDKVDLVISKYDLTKGRIIYRHAR